MNVYLLLGKSGDILSLLRCLHHEWTVTGIKPKLMVSREYAPILERAPYVEAIVHDGWRDLTSALKWAKTRYDKVICPQLHGDGFTFQHRHPSWQHDQWDRAGYMDKWDTLPLVLERPSNAVEIAAKYIHGPTIVFADHGQSSPFWHKDELAALLKEHFGESHRILRLSEIRVTNPLDLLPIIDAASALVTIDSLPLHLSAASTTPVIALATDKPSLWHGSAWSHRFAFYCRYSEFEQRKDELVSALKDALAKRHLPIGKSFKAQGFGYNLSTVQVQDSTVGVYRYHPSKTSWRTELMYFDGLTHHKLQPPAAYAEFSHEDARLFIHKGKLCISWVVARSASTAGRDVFRCACAHGILAKSSEGGYGITNAFLPRYGRNDFTSMEKNWTPFSINDQLWFIYGVKEKKQVCIRVDGDNMASEQVSDAPSWAWGQIRGGVVVPQGDQLLRFFHSREDDHSRQKDYQFRYHCGAALMENKPPFRTLKVSSRPILSGNEEYMPGSPSWKRNVVIPFGCVQKDDRYLLSVGVNDSACRTVELRCEDLNL